MKATLVFLVYLMGLGFVCAQEINCVEKQKELARYVSEGKYKQASEILPSLRKKCASQNEELYALGITTLKYNFDVAEGEAKDAALTDLLKFYDQYDANFPKNKNGNLVQKAMLLYDNQKGTDAEIYNFLDKAFTANPDQFTSANSLFVYFKLYHENYKNKREAVALEQLLEKFNAVQTAIEKASEAAPSKKAEFTNATRATRALVNEYLVPENLIAMAEKKFEANKENTQWLITTANLLADKCAETPIFGKIATQLHSLKPTSESAYHLASYNIKNKNQKQAMTYFEEAANLSAVPFYKAKVYYTMATILAGSEKEQAKKMIGLAIENNKKNGSYYILLANMYANSVTECGTTPLQQKAIYELATRTALMAGDIEPRIKALSNQMAVEYGKSSFTQKEQDEIRKKGSKIKIDCWINETVSF